jgi:MoaA/NifB/PqqE/SkfB family radical SAM enzyme
MLPSAEASHRTKGLLRLTMACNERCPFCNVPVEDYARPTPPDAEVGAELRAFVASGAQTLTISGGEPTLLRRRLVAVVAEARASGVPFVELQTNAILVDPAYAAALAAAGVTSAFVSLLSHTAALHDELAGLSGAFSRCLAGVDALLDAGIRVTLNPVTARQTERHVAAYVDFVATRLPRVRSISLSAVQPHGRARADLELLPDYAVLASSVRDARVRAAAAGIELLNPYCGLPLCVGWEDGLDASVEAIEAASGGWRETPGIENRDDKRHGPPCRGCALRTRCGGAWHAYWDVRGGSGLVAPLRVVEPWSPGGTSAAGQAVASELADLVGTAPTLWLWTDRLGRGCATALLASPCTDLALDVGAEALFADRITLRELRVVQRANLARQAPRRLRVHLGVRPNGDAHAVGRVAELAVALGVDAVRVLSPDARWVGVVRALAPRYPSLDLGVEARAAPRPAPGRGA